jgi:DNA-directed RNA polymerase subunit RPC12/RpoP
LESEHSKEGLLNGLRCPRCGSSDVRPSKREGLIDAIWASFDRSPVRCRSCRHRFYIRPETTHPVENR